MLERDSIAYFDLRGEIEPYLADLEAAAVRVIQSGRYLRGDEVARFERDFSRRIGRGEAVACANGLDALRLGLHALRIGPGDEVIVPALTFVATASAVLLAGATPVVVDVEPGTLLLDRRKVADAISARTRAVIPVHIFGQMADVERLQSTLQSIGSVAEILEDAAQAHLATLAGRTPGEGTAGACYSFYPGKNLGALGDAGAFLSDRSAYINDARCFANYGAAAPYQHDQVGINSRMDEIQAAFLSVRILHLEQETRGRRAVAARYLEAFSGISEIETLEVDAMSDPVWHVFPVRIRGARRGSTSSRQKRDCLIRKLKEHGICAQIHYPYTLRDVPALQGCTRAPGPVPNAEAAAATLISLPIYGSMCQRDVERVIDVLVEVVAEIGDS